MGFTQPLIMLAIEAKSRADREKLGVGLRALMAEDPTIHVQADHETGQVVIGGMGELHLDLILDRLVREFNVEAYVGKPQVAYKETFTRQADGDGRFVRQTGGRGQYGHAKVHLYPGERGTGYVFQSEITSGLIPNEYVEAIDAGIKEALAPGVLAGYPIDDVKVALRDGSYHEVDSSAVAFKIAGAMAFRDAAKKAWPVLLEPMMRVEVNVPAEYVSDVIADLLDRRGQIRSQQDLGDAQALQARVPLSEMFGYRADLHSCTRGRATYSMTFDGYEQCPGDLGDDDRSSPVGAPRKTGPKGHLSTTALPEPDENGDPPTN